MVTPVLYEHRYYSRNDLFNLGALSDFHLGAKACDKRRINRNVEWIDQWCHKAVFNGDAADAINFKDKRFDVKSVDRELLTPREQYKAVYTALEPIAEKLLVVAGGNHDGAIAKMESNDYLEDVADDLGVPYAERSAYIRLQFKRYSQDGDNYSGHQSSFNIYMHHGSGGARTKGGKLNKVKKMDEIFEADCYLMGHVHDMETIRVPLLDFDDRMNLIQLKKYYALTGGFLKGYEVDNCNYVEQGMYAPTSLGGIFLSINCEMNMSTNCRISDIPVEVS